MAAAPSPAWQDLPTDLLGLVLLRLPSLADRARLRAVCRSWRAGGHRRRHPLLPPPLPWLALRDGTLVDLDGAPVRCSTPVLPDGGGFSYVPVDNLALVWDHGGKSCSLVNPISDSSAAAVTSLPNLAAAVRRAVHESKYHGSEHHATAYVKAILSSPLDASPEPIAAILLEGSAIAVSSCNQQKGISISSAPDRSKNPSKSVSDIAFFHGKLYTISGDEGLDTLELDAGVPSSRPRQVIPDDPEQQLIYEFGTHHQLVVLRYLVESDGRLLMVRRWMQYRYNTRLGDSEKTLRFEVFEAVDLTADHGRWMKVDSLRGQAIFFGSQCSKSVPASQFGAQEDCIYFIHRVYDNPASICFRPHANHLGDSGVYNMRDGVIKPLLPESVMKELQHKRQFLTWFFPVDV